MRPLRLLALSLLVLTASAAFAQDARSQALALYKSIQKQNWKAMYYLVAFSPKVARTLEGADKFAKGVAQGIQNSGNGDKVAAILGGMRNLSVGKATVKGNKATVPTSVLVTVDGNTTKFNGLARMIRVGGKWKWDLTVSDDARFATQQAIGELIGKPAR